MSDERRERYAAAVRSAGDTAYGRQPFYDAIADAAMAVADVDVAAVQAELNGTLRREHERANQAQQRADDYEDEIESLSAENARLRTALHEAAANARNFPITTVEPDYSAGYRDGREDVAVQLEESAPWNLDGQGDDGHNPLVKDHVATCDQCKPVRERHECNTVMARSEMEEPLGYYICGICGACV